MEAPRGTPKVTPLRRARRLRRISMKQMAADLGVTPETVRRWERRLTLPLYPEAVAAYLGISVDEVTGRGEG